MVVWEKDSRAPILVTLVVTLLAALLVLARSGWYERGHLPWLIVWTLPLALVSAGFARHLLSYAWNPYACFPVALITGALCGLAWSYTAMAVPFWILRSPLAFGFENQFVWPFAAAAGMGVALTSRFSKPVITSTAFVLLMSLSPLMCLEAKPYILDEQELTIIKMKRIASGNTLTIVGTGYLTAEDINVLDASGITGVLEFTGMSDASRMPGFGWRGPLSRALVVSTMPLEREVVVNQPFHTTAVYVQTSDRVDILPAGVPLHRWRLRFDNHNYGGALTRVVNVSQEHPGWSGGGPILW